ncbi:hypothetical protein DL767_009629 [Monosporascus sp. MG133]|nr:hypothetical protein DL767_009629 [Monosporascus sp. MG133]
MAPHDSDSSGDEQDDYTETNVLLGYASKEPEDISHLGGRPEWLDPDSPPSAALARCKVCGDLTALLLQLNAELPAQFPGHERRLYVFACRRRTCRRKEGSVRAVRGVRITSGTSGSTAPEKTKKRREEPREEEEERPKSPAANLGETLFGAKTLGSSSSGPANPFSTGGGNPFAGSSALNPFSNPQAAAEAPTPNPEPAEPPPSGDDAKEEQREQQLQSLPKTFAETLSLNNPQAQAQAPAPAEPWPPESAQPRPYPVSYLTDAEYETLDPTPAPASQSTVRMEVANDGGGGKGAKEDRDVFESSMDATFQRFADRMAQNPDQVIRYEFGGQPLLYSKADAVGVLLGGGGGDGRPAARVAGPKGMPRCANCGAGRVFEVQLCPNAITELEADEMSLEGMDWGTVIVGVCERDCQARGVEEGKAGYLEEWAGVQWEELTSRR